MVIVYSYERVCVCVCALYMYVCVLYDAITVCVCVQMDRCYAGIDLTHIQPVNVSSHVCSQLGDIRPNN